MNCSHARFCGGVLAIVLGYFLFGLARNAWRNYWLLTDGKEGVAIVTGESWSGHNAVDYEYAVNQTEYTGLSARNWQDPRYSKVQPGDESIIYFSASHPWLSRLNKPQAVLEGWPVTFVLIVLEVLALVTVINPRSNFALDFSGKTGPQSAFRATPSSRWRRRREP